MKLLMEVLAILIRESSFPVTMRQYIGSFFCVKKNILIFNTK